MKKNKKQNGMEQEDDLWTKLQQRQLEEAYTKAVSQGGLAWRTDASLLKAFFEHVKQGVKGKSAYQCFQRFQVIRTEAKKCVLRGNSAPTCPSTVSGVDPKISNELQTSVGNEAKTITAAGEPCDSTGRTEGADNDQCIKSQYKSSSFAPWNENEQHQLDVALAMYRHIEDTQDRWRAISAKIPSRSLKECVAQYKRLRQALRKNMNTGEPLGEV